MFGGLKDSYFLVSKRDLVSKTKNFKNVHGLSHIKLLSLNFSELPSKDLAVLGLCFLYLLTNKKGITTVGGKNSFKRKKCIGCNLKLNKKDSLTFLSKFLDFNFRGISELENGFRKDSFSNVGTFSFMIKEIQCFNNIGESLLKFRRLKNLNVNISFNDNNEFVNLLLLRSLGFLFRK